VRPPFRPPRTGGGDFLTLEERRQLARGGEPNARGCNARYGARTTIERLRVTPLDEIDTISLRRVPCFTARRGYQ
jgi:hypothetical protein